MLGEAISARQAALGSGASQLSPSTFASGEEALALLTAAREEIDLVLLDLTMPGLDGRETLKRLRESGSRVPVLFSSGFAGAEPAALCRELDAQGFIPKPYSMQVLLDAVREALSAASAR